MLGIPFRIKCEVEGELVDKVLYLRSRRIGAAGKAMTKAKKAYYAASMACAKAAQRWKNANRRLEELPADYEKFEVLEVKQEGALGEIQEKSEAAKEAALEVVRLALVENYGKGETEAVLDVLLDGDLDVMISAIETGELPADFIAGGGAPPKSTPTTPPGDGPGTSSSPAGSPRRRSRKGKSASTKRT